MELLNLKSMCALLNVSRRIIQCYEKAGLLSPSGKNKYGHLLYDESAFYRAKMIRFLQQAGFTLREVEKIIDAPKPVMKEALKNKLNELKKEKIRISQIIQKANDYIDSLN